MTVHHDNQAKIDPIAPKSLFLATMAFVIAFANWGLIAGFEAKL